MQVLSLIWGILALLGMFVAMTPCLGSLNWINIPFGGLGLLISIISVASAKEAGKGMGIAGIVLCAAAVVLGSVRLVLGAGVA